MRILGVCALALVLGFPASNAFATDWAPFPDLKPLVGVGYTHDDGGALIVVCNPTQKLMSYVLREPRANWHTGDTMKVQTRADDGSQMQPSTGQVIGPQEIVVGEESTWDLSIMGKGAKFFFTGVGGYARVWPVSNFKEATTLALQACGDHW